VDNAGYEKYFRASSARAHQNTAAAVLYVNTPISHRNTHKFLVNGESVTVQQGFAFATFTAPVALTPLAVKFVMFTSSGCPQFR